RLVMWYATQGFFQAPSSAGPTGSMRITFASARSISDLPGEETTAPCGDGGQGACAVPPRALSEKEGRSPFQNETGPGSGPRLSAWAASAAVGSTRRCGRTAPRTWRRFLEGRGGTVSCAWDC